MGLPVALILLLFSQPTFADAPGDRHLPVIPRTAAEATLVATILTPTVDFSTPEPSEAESAGAATVSSRPDAEAFSRVSANMHISRQKDFKLGRALFNKLWIAAPAATTASDGLGPLYNARACEACHKRDGRGHAPENPGTPALSMVLHLSVPGGTTPEAIEGWLATQGEPRYGSQLQDLATPGQTAEGRMQIHYAEQAVTLADGMVVSLRAPAYTIAAPGYGALPKGIMLSPRVAPQMIGLGLLEAIPAADILALADPGDADGNGISGRAQIVPSQEFGVPMLGRFGLKAGVPTIREQAALAFSTDMGLSTVLYSVSAGDCTAEQAACRSAPNGAQYVDDGQEVSAKRLDLVAHYARNLGVPARRGAGAPQVLRGKQVFHALNCTGCHTPKHMTHRLAGQPEQSFQLIWPYTDLLLHDMGPGLADNRPEGRATGLEWRTAPLWGTGLTASVSGHTQFLHDGRARSLLEAILWHGGEAQAARDGLVALPAADRDALLAFLESL